MEQIKKDLEFLSGKLEHRSVASLEERAAAAYLLHRLKPLVRTAGIVPYNVAPEYGKIKAAYVAEFFVVSLLAIPWPTFALIYGLFVFSFYLGESYGYPFLSRLVSTREGHAVGGGSNPGKHKTLLVFTAYLDSGYSLTSHPLFLRLSHYLELLLRSAMVFTLATCALDVMAKSQRASYPFSTTLHWSTGAFFLAAAAVILFSSRQEKKSGGANHNASGLAALLRVAEKLQETPLEDISTLFYLPGAHHANNRGMQHFLSTLKKKHGHIFLVNLESVGAGELCYSDSEGVLQSFACSSKLVQAADACASGWGARKVALRSLISNAYLPLLQGYEAISLLGLDRNNRPLHYKKEEDIVDNIDMNLIEASADLAVALVRQAFSEDDLQTDAPDDENAPL